MDIYATEDECWLILCLYTVESVKFVVMLPKIVGVIS